MCVFSDPLVSGQTPPLIYQGELQGDGGKVEDSLRFQAYLQPPPPLLPEPPVASTRGSSRETGGRGKKNPLKAAALHSNCLYIST